MRVAVMEFMLAGSLSVDTKVAMTDSVLAGRLEI